MVNYIHKEFLDILSSVDWMDGQTKERAKGKVNGINTQGENIADNGGIKEAFRAYLHWIQDRGAEDFLPGIKYSPTQLFWISAANVWCGKYRPEVLKLRIMTGSHSPAPYRVIGPLTNTPQFGCPLGSPMNPVKKCTVW